MDDGSGSAGGAWPGWVSGPLVVLLSFGSAWLVTRLGVWLAARRFARSVPDFWVERARLAYLPRKVVGGDSILAPLSIGAVVGFHVAPAVGLSGLAWGVLAGVASLLAVHRVGLGLERRICAPAGPDGPARRGITLGMLLILPALIPFALMLALIPSHWGWGAVAVLAGGAALTTIHIRGGWLGPLRRLGLARPASARLEAVVARAADRMGVRPRATFEVDSPHSNALAWPVPKLLVFAGPLWAEIDDASLETIVAHELGHLNEPRSVYLVRAITPYFLVACAATNPLTASFGPAVGLAPFVVMLAFVVIARRVGRRMEERSDRLAVEHEGEVAGTYARALESLHRANLLPVVLRGKLQNIHPDLYDRMVSSGVTPDYPRPKPPPRDVLGSMPGVLLLAVGAWALIAGLNPRP